MQLSSMATTLALMLLFYIAITTGLGFLVSGKGGSAGGLGALCACLILNLATLLYSAVYIQPVQALISTVRGYSVELNL